MAVKILNAANLRSDSKDKLKSVAIYEGGPSEIRANQVNRTAVQPVKFRNSGSVWKNSETQRQFWNSRIKPLEDELRNTIRLGNAATGYSRQRFVELATLYTIDLTRSADDLADYTPVLYEDRVNSEATDPSYIKDYLPYVGKEESIAGASDKVPLMEHKLAEEAIVRLDIRGFGDKTTIRELLLNPFYKTQNVLDSAARILADAKNADSIGRIVTADYSINAAFTQAADTTGTTYDVKLYNTIKGAIRKVRALNNLPTKKLIGSTQHELHLLVNANDLSDIEPVVNGQLGQVGGLQQLVSALPLDSIIPYSGGLNDGQPYGGETLSFPGVPQGSAYLVAKVAVYGGYRITKISETMQVQDGDILGLTGEKRAWYRIRGIFDTWVLPSVVSATPYGSVCKITLPTP